MRYEQAENTSKSAVIEPQEDDTGYAIAFNHEKASVMIYYTQDLTKADEALYAVKGIVAQMLGC